MQANKLETTIYPKKVVTGHYTKTRFLLDGKWHKVNDVINIEYDVSVNCSSCVFFEDDGTMEVCRNEEFIKMVGLKNRKFVFVNKDFCCKHYKLKAEMGDYFRNSSNAINGTRTSSRPILAEKL